MIGCDEGGTGRLAVGLGGSFGLRVVGDGSVAEEARSIRKGRVVVDGAAVLVAEEPSVDSIFTRGGDEALVLRTQWSTVGGLLEEGGDGLIVGEQDVLLRGARVDAVDEEAPLVVEILVSCITADGEGDIGGVEAEELPPVIG